MSADDVYVFENIISKEYSWIDDDNVEFTGITIHLDHIEIKRINGYWYSNALFWPHCSPISNILCIDPDDYIINYSDNHDLIKDKLLEYLEVCSADDGYWSLSGFDIKKTHYTQDDFFICPYRLTVNIKCCGYKMRCGTLIGSDKILSKIPKELHYFNQIKICSMCGGYFHESKKCEH